MIPCEFKVVNFVSGKGGVGKTMLAVAFAREFAQAQKTVILDLDFFNRGLTGLLRHGKKMQSIQRPAFLGMDQDKESGENADATEWSLVRVAPNLLHIAYPDLSDADIRRLETRTVNDTSSDLRSYLEHLAELTGARLIVLDCHGGPDHLSFAACKVADFSILVSEPDKITFYGTMHFVRQLESVTSPAAIKSLYLVFNKVVPAFSSFYLTRFYNQSVRSFFDGKPLLSIIPLEVYLTKEFENTPFLTDVYPYSALAKKMRLIGYDLFHENCPEILPKSFRRINWLDRIATRISLAKIPAILNIDMIMAILTISAMLFFLLTLGNRQNDPWLGNLVQKTAQMEFSDLASGRVPAIPSCSGEAGAVNQANCAVSTCRQFTYGFVENLTASGEALRTQCIPIIKNYSSLFEDPNNSAKKRLFKVIDAPAEKLFAQSPDPDIRKSAAEIKQSIEKNRWREIMLVLPSTEVSTPFFAILLSWFAFALLLNWSGVLDRSFTYQFRRRRISRAVGICLVVLALWSTYSFFYILLPELWGFSRPLACLGLLPVLFVGMNQAYKAWMEIWRERRFVEGAFRSVFVALLIAQALLSYKLKNLG